MGPTAQEDWNTVLKVSRVEGQDPRGGSAPKRAGAGWMTSPSQKGWGGGRKEEEERVRGRVKVWMWLRGQAGDNDWAWPALKQRESLSSVLSSPPLAVTLLCRVCSTSPSSWPMLLPWGLPFPQGKPVAPADVQSLPSLLVPPSPPTLLCPNQLLAYHRATTGLH